MNRTNSGANTSTLQILLDTLLLIIAYGIASVWAVFSFGFQQDLAHTVLLGIFVVIYLLSNKEQYVYNVTLFYYLDRMHRKLTQSFLLAMISTAALLYFLDETEGGKLFYMCFLIVAYLLVCLKMFISRPLVRFLQKNEMPRTAFVGKPGEFNKFLYFMNKTSIQVKEVGYIAMTREELEAGNYIGCLEDLESLIRNHNIDQLYIIQKDGNALPFTQQSVDLCISMGVTVRLIVDFYKRRRANSYVSTVGTYPIITYHTVYLSTFEKFVKRVMDLAGGLVGVILSSPIMLVTAIAIKLDSPGPIIFKQTRVGQNGRTFKIFKFRSMYIDAEERKKELMAQNEIEGGVMFKMKDDPRITKVGKVIRKLSIDELPQFFNIVLGDMSLVGTRPPTIDEVEKYKTEQWRRISIKPGLTGMWQVNGRSNIQNFDEIVELDVEYIDNWSLWLDIKILFKTVLVILAHKDAC